MLQDYMKICINFTKKLDSKLNMMGKNLEKQILDLQREINKQRSIGIPSDREAFEYFSHQEYLTNEAFNELNYIYSMEKVPQFKIDSGSQIMLSSDNDIADELRIKGNEQYRNGNL